MENFSESVSTNIAQAMDPKSTMDYGTAFKNIMDSSIGVVNGWKKEGKVNVMMGGMLVNHIGGCWYIIFSKSH